MQEKKTNIFNDKLLLIFILLTGISLRFFNISNLHLSNDELSAISRALYKNTGELINKGIMPDGHPALIQIFLYLYIKIIGFNDFMIKLPFLLSGITTIYLSYITAKAYFNKTTGLLTAAMISSMQFTVMYSQLARPYITGLMFVLSTSYFLHKFTQNKKINKYHALLFTISLTLSAYNHYFSLLQAALIFISGFFIVNKKNIATYIISGTLSVILFLPHTKITIHQLNLKGLNWLAIPDSGFFWKYLGFSINYCWLLGFFITGIFIYSFKYKKNGYTRFIMLLLGITPFIIAYYYSIYIAPVLQISVLLFSYPFLLIFIFSGLKNLNTKQNALLTGIILILGILSLIFVRKYYKYAYENKFNNTAENISYAIKKHGEKYSAMIFINKKFYLNYYLNKQNIDDNKLNNLYFITPDNHNNIDSIITKSKSNIFGLATLISYSDLININKIKEKYPYIKYIDNYYLELSKEKCTFEKKSNILDTVFTKNFYYNTKQYTNNEWGPGFELDLDTLLSHPNNIAIASAELEINDSNKIDIKLVSVIKDSSNKKIHWASSDININNIKYHKKIFLYKLIFLQDIKNARFNKIYIWNRSKSKIKTYKINYTILNGRKNPYGLYTNLN